MFKLGRIGPFDVHQGLIRLHHSIGDELIHLISISTDQDRGWECETYADQILVHAQSLEITATKDHGAEVLSNRLMQAFGRW